MDVKIYITLLALIFLSTESMAQLPVEPAKTDDQFFEDAIKPTPIPAAKIEKVLRNYAETLGCDFSMNKKNIVEIDIDQDEYQEKEFVALFNLDAGCAGGSGTGKSNFAVLKYRDIFHKKLIYVRSDLSEPSISSYGFPRFIDRLFIKNGQLWYSGRIHKKNDANNSPTSSVQAQFNLVKNEMTISPKQTATVYYWRSSKDYAN